ncbi:minor capsid protein [Cytobacillus firmus]|uniref:Minor capsid protein n=1 Tax=Cytobacillus firmus TaxID=1399 RepID=A0AA46SGV2_CYTFI|nr:minor capsid protein [Cytobacillus firmus]UYG93187.1 minor capsid protein [Cytobacillus firmus]
MDFLFRVMDYIENNVQLNAPINSPVLDSDSSAVAIRQTPSTMNTRFIEGKTADFSFQILVKDKSHLACYNTIQAIFKALDGLSKGDIVSSDGSFSFIKCECYTLPNFVEKTEHDEYIYTALFTAELE